MNRRGRERRARPAPSPVEVDTPFAHAEVVFERSSRTLLLDGREAGQVDLADPTRLEFGYMRRIADLVDALRAPAVGLAVLHVGGGAFALPRYVAATRPRSRQRVFELDPGVVALAREHLGLRSTPRLRVQEGDAAALLPARPDRSADLVIGDAFRGPFVPDQLAGRTFVGHVKRVLRASGAYALNVVDVPGLQEVHAHDTVIAEAFAHVAWVAPPGVLRGRAPGNVVILASDAPLPLGALRRAATAAIPREQVLERARAAA